MENRNLFAVVVLTFFVAVSTAYTQTTDFFDLVTSGTPKDVQAAIFKGADVNARTLAGWTPLMFAARYDRNLDVITALLKAGADVNARDSKGETPLMFAAEHNPNPDVVTTLLKAAANVNARSSSGDTPLMLAAMSNPNPDVVTTLLQAGADVKAKDNIGATAFDYAQGNEKLKKTKAYWALNDAQY
ncbi:MAG: ankyrin repeat domain-containing protein [Rectinemataceae bacterium]|jgi:ankyrin repeat protein